jgi:creatinine amidohydrolase
MPRVFTGIWWYADHPDHYAGDAEPANVALGELVLKLGSDDLAKLIREVKQDRVTPELQEEFFGRVVGWPPGPG